MNKKENNSIEKLDMQIEKLSSNEYDNTNTPLLDRSELDRKIKLEKLDEEIESKKKKNNSNGDDHFTTKTIQFDKVSFDEGIISDEKFETKEVKKINKVKIDDRVKDKISSSKEVINEVLDNQEEADKLIKLLANVFAVLITIVIIFFMFIIFYN